MMQLPSSLPTNITDQSRKYSSKKSFSDINFQGKCEFCRPLVEFHDRTRFAQHLRQVHCTREGGSFICRYGPNGVCQTLPLEGVSDDDYETHIRKFHMRLVARGNLGTSNYESLRRLTADSKEPFTVQSFTQNLSSVLSDPKRSRYEIRTFFTRHWGDSFVTKNSIPNSVLIPTVTSKNFKSYLSTVAQKHQCCLKTRKKHRNEQTFTADSNGIPTIFLDPHFTLADSLTFNSILLESESTSVHYLNVKRVDADENEESTCQNNDLCHTSSVGYRRFRSRHDLQHELEDYQDLVDMRLNSQLAAKSNAFWGTVVSYGCLHSELDEAIAKIVVVRRSLRTVKEKIFGEKYKIVDLYRTRQRKVKLLQKLQDMACLRDSQATVQMLLNQNDFPKALECIETAQDVLNSDLRGVVCFKYLGSQLHELQKMIGRMLHEEFITLIEKEFGRPCATPDEAIYEESRLNPILLGLLKLRQFRFINLLQQLIEEDLKNSFRQILKMHVDGCRDQACEDEFDSIASDLRAQIRRLSFDQWLKAFDHALGAFYLKCLRIQSLQELIVENIDQCETLEGKRFRTSPNDESASNKLPEQQPEGKFNFAEICTETGSDTDDTSSQSKFSSQSFSSGLAKNSSDQSITSHSADIAIRTENTRETARVYMPTPLAILSMPCENVAQVRQSTLLLVEYAVFCCEERTRKSLLSSSKEGFFERRTLAEFNRVICTIGNFTRKQRSLVRSSEGYHSSLRFCIVQQSSAFIKRFHDDRRKKLGNILDSESWRVGDVPEYFIRLVDEVSRSGRLGDVPLSEKKLTKQVSVLSIDGENYFVAGTALILLQMMAQYCDALEIFPEFAKEVLMCLVEILKNYNSRSCQLVLGAGAVQLLGLKSISVRNLALSSRSLQFILKFIPYVSRQFEVRLDGTKNNLTRSVGQIVKDYNDHIQEIMCKLVAVIECHLSAQLEMWNIESVVPSLAFNQISRYLVKFHSGLNAILPESVIKDLFIHAHQRFKYALKNRLNELNVSPHDSLTYGLASQEYLYYMKTLRSLSCCSDFRDESISDSFFCKMQESG